LLLTAVLAVGLVGILVGGYGAGQVRAAADSRPTLWVLAIGVSRYVDPDLELRFAAADARAIADALAEQRSGPLYRDVKVKTLLDTEVTRRTIFESLEAFLGQAAPTDMGLIYLAGHGMQDASTGGYYFLPATASRENMVYEGMDMVELERQVRRLNDNIGSLVVMLDTCYAARAAAGSRDLTLGADLASRLGATEGLYVLAAAKAGEQSRETESLGHGVFTKAILDGLGGAAADPAGLVTVLRLAEYVGLTVPQWTEGKQHPYHDIRGGNPVLAVDLKRASAAKASIVAPRGEPTEQPIQSGRIAVMRFDDLREDPEHRWMEDGLREEFTTALNDVTQLEVYAEPEIRLMARGAVDAMDAARRAGMEMVVSGSFAVQEGRISITAHIKDVATMKHIASTKMEGPINEFFDLRSRIALHLLERLRLELPASEVARILRPGTTNLEARRLLLEAEGAAVSEKTPAVTPKRREDRGASLWRLFTISSLAYAEEGDGAESQLRALLEEYRASFEKKDIDAVERYYENFTDEQRKAIEGYFSMADELKVVFTDIRVTAFGDRAAVSFTRNDRFVDRDTGDLQEIRIRQTKTLARRPAGWRIVPSADQ
jgi:uncharacterized caspase-like protein